MRLNLEVGDGELNIGDGAAAERGSVITGDVLNRMGVIRSRWIAVGNADRLIVPNRIGERELNGGTVDRNSGDGIGTAICGDGEGRTGCCC